MSNKHIVTDALKLRISDLAKAGIPVYLIAKIVELDDETLTKHYQRELLCAQAEQVNRIAQCVARQAEEGNEKSQALCLKTQGAKFGWVEKQVVESTSSEETKELQEKIQELESKYEQDY